MKLRSRHIFKTNLIGKNGISYDLERGVALIELIGACLFGFVLWLIIFRILSVWFPLFSLTSSKVFLLAIAIPVLGPLTMVILASALYLISHTFEILGFVNQVFTMLTKTPFSLVNQLFIELGLERTIIVIFSVWGLSASIYGLVAGWVIGHVLAAAFLPQLCLVVLWYCTFFLLDRIEQIGQDRINNIKKKHQEIIRAKGGVGRKLTDAEMQESIKSFAAYEGSEDYQRMMKRMKKGKSS